MDEARHGFIVWAVDLSRFALAIEFSMALQIIVIINNIHSTSNSVKNAPPRLNMPGSPSAIFNLSNKGLSFLLCAELSDGRGAILNSSPTSDYRPSE